MSEEKTGKRCMVSNCHNIAVANDLCDKHRKRLARHGSVDAARPADWGAREKHPLYTVWNGLVRYHRHETIERWHDLWAFASDIGDSRPSKKHLLTRKNSELPYGPDNFYWREPRVIGRDDLAANAERMRKWRMANQEKSLDDSFRKRYGIRLSDYEAMVASQGGVCAICLQPETRIDHRSGQVSRLAVDHCHKTKAVRELLCQHCNTALGGFDDSTVEMAAAIAYVSRHSADAASFLMGAISTLQAALPAAGTA